MTESHITVEDGIPIGNVYPKYQTTNPIARRLMRGFLASFTELVRSTGADEVHEVGCGEGHLAIRLHELGLEVRASDFSRQVIAEARETARRREVPADAIDFFVKSVYAMSPEEDAAPLVVCCEVLEHLERPDDAIRALAALARPHLLVSVPREPLWRALNVARGKYLRDLGNTPGHLQHWSKRRFLAALAAHLDVVAVRSPLPWTMALCVARGGAV